MESHVNITLQEGTGDLISDESIEQMTDLVAVIRSGGFETAANAVMLLVVYMANTAKMTDSNFEAWLHAMRENRKTMSQLRDGPLAETPCGFRSTPS